MPRREEMPMQHSSHRAHQTEHPAGAHQAGHPSGQRGLVTLEVPTGPLPCCQCRETVQQQLKANPHVASVHLDPEHRLAHVQAHEGMVTAEELAEVIAYTCGERNPVPLPKPEVSAHAHEHTARPALADHAGHGAADTSEHAGHAAHSSAAP